MSKRMLLMGAMVCALTLGLFAPGLILGALDTKLTGGQWDMPGGEGEYVYEGTLENRVRALEAWQNGSTGVKYAKREGELGESAPDVWRELYAAGLLPINAEDTETEASMFSLSPARVSAEYSYLDITLKAVDAKLHVILDAATRAYLRIDFTCDPDTFESWMQNTGEGFHTIYKSDELMHAYAKLLGYGAPDELDYMDGELIKGYESNIERTLYAISMRYATKQGLLMYRFIAKPLM